MCAAAASCGCYSYRAAHHKVGSGLDAACGAVGAAAASVVSGEYTQCAPPFVRIHSHRGDIGATHARTGREQPLPAATARATGLLTKVGSDLDEACGAVGAAVASDVRGEYFRRSMYHDLLKVKIIESGPTALKTIESLNLQIS